VRGYDRSVDRPKIISRLLGNKLGYA